MNEKNKIQHIRINNEALVKKFRNDKTIKWYNKQINCILKTAIPIRLEMSDDYMPEVVYSKQTTKLLDKIKKERDNYIKNTYQIDE